MAEVNTGGKGGGKKGSKKVSTKIDMTPMVDLGFLLITFFMLTTTLSKPKTMEINMPDKTKEEQTMKVKESKTITIVLGNENKVFYYQGVQDPKIETTNYAPEGIRRVLLEKLRSIGDPIIIIKAMETSKYRNMVDILDEMSITGIKSYAIVKITPQDLDIIDKQTGKTPASASPTTPTNG